MKIKSLNKAANLKDSYTLIQIQIVLFFKKKNPEKIPFV